MLFHQAKRVQSPLYYQRKAKHKKRWQETPINAPYLVGKVFVLYVLTLFQKVAVALYKTLMDDSSSYNKPTKFLNPMR